MHKNAPANFGEIRQGLFPRKILEEREINQREKNDNWQKNDYKAQE